MTPPSTAKDALEGACAEDSCGWWTWAEMAACPACGEAFCPEHVLPADHGCIEDES